MSLAVRAGLLAQLARALLRVINNVCIPVRRRKLFTR